MPFLPSQLFLWLTENAAALHDALTTPSLWSQFANEEAYHIVVLIFQAAKALNIPYNGNYNIPSGPVQGGDDETPPQGPISHAFEAIIGADNFVDIDNHVVMRDVLNEIVSVTQTVSQTCEWLSGAHGQNVVDPNSLS